MQLSKSKKRKCLLFPVIMIQVAIALYLGIKIYQKQMKVLGTKVYAPIEKESIIVNPDSELQRFYEPAPNTIENVNPWVPYKATYTINSDSLNERFEYSPEKPDRTFRIITLGDSYTYGLYVDTENNYSEKLEDKLNDTLSCNNYDQFEVINLGVGGYDIQYASERYKIRGQKYNPDLIIWFIKNGDMVQLNERMLVEEKIIAAELKKTGEFDKLVKKGNFYPSWSRAMQKVIDTYGRVHLFKTQMNFLENFRDTYVNPLLIITFPSTNGEYKRALEELTASRDNMTFHGNIPDIYNINGASFPNDGHPTILGHTIITDNLFEYLTKEGFISCE